MGRGGTPKPYSNRYHIIVVLFFSRFSDKRALIKRKTKNTIIFLILKKKITNNMVYVIYLLETPFGKNNN